MEFCKECRSFQLTVGATAGQLHWSNEFDLRRVHDPVPLMKAALSWLGNRTAQQTCLALALACPHLRALGLMHRAASVFQSIGFDP
jgi:hypothetical protein